MKKWEDIMKKLIWGQKFFQKFFQIMIQMEKRKIQDLSSIERKKVLMKFFNEVFFPQRNRLLYFRKISNQSAQVDSDGHIAQLIASIVTGIPGTNRHGKSGDLAGDLFDGTEVKSTYKCEQKDEKEDAHINFGGMNTKKMEEFLKHKRCIIVHTYYDTLNRFKTEILDLDLDSEQFKKKFKELQDNSKAKNPQFQPRLYPDGKRDKLNKTQSSFLNFNARVLARVVETKEGALVDIWSPEDGEELENLLKISKPHSIPNKKIRNNKKPLSKLSLLERERLSRYFFEECFLKFRSSFIKYCKLTSTTQNLGFSNLSQHLVSFITGIKGTGSNARGFDLIDRSEIKQAMGIKGDDFGTEDWPRLNLGNKILEILSWKTLYASRIMIINGIIKIKVSRPNMKLFRNQVKDYFSKKSLYKKSINIQYHAPKTFENDFFTGKDSIGGERRLEFKPILTLISDGSIKGSFMSTKNKISPEILNVIFRNLDSQN